jgi:hypothetical protein
MNRDISLSVDPDEIVETDVNSSGQVYIGRELADETVRIAIEVVDDE